MIEKSHVYDKLAKNYDRALQPLERWFLSQWRQETLSFLSSEVKILEIGAGTGLNFTFYPQNCDGTAGEISFKMIEFAKDKIKGKNISLIQNDAENLPFIENSFDAAFATLVFCSVSNPSNAFRELQRVVRPNGKIILLEHVRPKGLLGYVFDLLNFFTVRLIEDHFNRQTAKLAADSGLKIVEVKAKALGTVNLIICEVIK